ncbi:MAG: FAD-linked oxidase C-terminal domain-containing protein [Burkholderiaceae bacterium]
MNHPMPHPSLLKKPLPIAVVQALTAAFGARFSMTEAIRLHHGRDESAFDPMLPDAVVFAHSTEEVATIVALCSRYEVPVIPYGTGSSLEGHLLAIRGGISLDVSEMNKVVAINAEDLTATVQAGVTRKQLNVEIKDTGLFFPIDPGADASLGGMAATRASGTNAVRYGTMRENVVSLTVVTADGKIVRTARRARKSSAGYDLTRIFVGSEGTLGIITEVTVKLYPLPEAISAAVCNFPTVDDAVRCVIQTIQMGVPIARVEFLDAAFVKAVNIHSKLTLKESPLLLFEFHGSEASVKEQAELVQEIASDHHGMEFTWATHPEDRSKLWSARHNAYFAGLQVKPGTRAITTDVCVPISKLADSINTTVADCEKSSLPSLILGHVGDGNYHVMLLIDPDKPEEFAEAERINHALVSRAIQMDGTCTGEHGVGLHKMPFLIEEHGEDALDLMRALKRAFDPNNIMNPGKIVAID